MKCLIMSGGVKPKDEIIKQYADFCDLIIGVDKGCNYLYDLDIKPNYIVGDFDSSNIEVIDSNLIYLLDSKGFYQPVYDFTININENINHIYICALK